MQNIRHLSLLVVLWLAMIVVFAVVSKMTNPLPAIALEGLNDVWLFYLPLMLFTLCAIFFFTRRRERPTWENFAVDHTMLKRDLLMVFAYLLISQILLGGLLDNGLHFPGPQVYSPDSHRAMDVFRWAGMQFLFYVVVPYLWLKGRGFSVRKMMRGIHFKRDAFIMLVFWVGDFAGTAFTSGFMQVPVGDYRYAIPAGILVNLLGAGLPVLIMVHIIVIPRLSLLFDSQLLVIVLAGFTYALFSLFDPGVSYSNVNAGLTSISYIFMTQVLIGMGKASFTVRTGNPFIHLTSYHILGARVAFDTAMYAEIFRR